MTWFHWFEVVTVLASMFGFMCAVDRVEHWAARRRRSRRSALERRMRARARCSECGAIGKTEFVDRATALLGQVRDTDQGRAIAAVLDYGKRAAARQARYGDDAA